MNLTLAQELLARLCMDGGSRILAIDEGRVLHVPDAGISAAADRAPTSIAVVPLTGSLNPTSLAAFASRMDAAAGNADVGTIVTPIDSPGGTYTGTPEAAAAMARAQAAKPVIAHVSGLMASAASWIGCQAGTVWMNPSAEAGSIGVIAMHFEVSKAMADMGVAMEIFRSIAGKADINMFEPLTAEARDHLNAEIADAHQEFVRAMATGRKTSQAKVSSDFGQGRTMSAQKAVAVGLADKIGSLNDVLASARGRVARASAAKRSALTFDF